MRQLVGTLVALIAASAAIFALSRAIGSPVLASYSTRQLADYCVMPGIITAVVLVAVTCTGSITIAPRPAALNQISIAALWCFEIWAMFIWSSLAIQLLGWMLIWGDNGPPLSILLPNAIALVVASVVATATTVKIYYRLATVTYVSVVSLMTLLLWALISPYLLWYFANFGRIPLLL